MKTYRDIKHILPSDTAVALGGFDGVHIGHAAVICAACAAAKQKNLFTCVFTFAGIPKNAFLPTPLPLICGVREKKRLISALGADFLLMPDFTDEIMRMPPEDFFEKVLVNICRAKHIVCGFNYSFGAGGAGDTGMLKDLCLRHGAELTVVPPVTLRDKAAPVSSTAVREAVRTGDTALAERLLGRKFSLVSEWQALEASPSPRITQFFEPGALVPKTGVYHALINGKPGLTRVFDIGGRHCAQSDFPGALPRAKRVKTEFVKPSF